VQDKRSTWAAKQELDEIKGVELRLPGLVEGAYQMTWLDTWKAAIVLAEAHKAPAKHIDKPLEATVVRVPPFKRDIALLITRAAGDK
ncbi:MAG: hypothetical protein NTW87_35535, partial [Planctomycetota bacterium]|nr:hypothetical protein [Planctomycetota bacterium]